jgi:hypothetical protein
MGARPEDHIIAHEKRSGNTSPLQKSPRPRDMLAKREGQDPVEDPGPGLEGEYPTCDPCRRSCCASGRILSSIYPSSFPSRLD